MAKDEILILKISKKDWGELSPDLWKKFEILKVEIDDYDEMIKDDKFCVLTSKKKKAEKELTEYKYNFRHGSSNKT